MIENRKIEMDKICPECGKTITLVLDRDIIVDSYLETKEPNNSTSDI